jgi:hypothetical protein
MLFDLLSIFLSVISVLSIYFSNVNVKREGITDATAVYFVQPTAENIQTIINVPISYSRAVCGWPSSDVVADVCVCVCCVCVLSLC